jgi:hypothetical protein
LSVSADFDQRHLVRHAPASAAAQTPDGRGDSQASTEALHKAGERENGAPTALAALNMQLPALDTTDRRRGCWFDMEGLLRHGSRPCIPRSGAHDAEACVVQFGSEVLGT